MSSRFSITVQRNLRHYSFFPEKGTESSTLGVLFLLAFLCSESRIAFIPHQFQDKVFWHFIKSLLSLIPWRVHECCCSAFLLHYIWMRNKCIFIARPVLKYKGRKEQSLFTPIVLLAFHKLKPGGLRYQRVFFTQDEKLCCSWTQKGWGAWLKWGLFPPISQVKTHGTRCNKATRFDHTRQKLNNAGSGCNSQSLF